MSDKVVDLPTPSRGRGRPKGTGGNKRPDKSRDMSVQTEPGDNRKYLEHSLKMWDWPSVDMKEPEQVKERIGMYFKLCADDDMKPSVAGLALAFEYTERLYGRGLLVLIARHFPLKAVTL